MNINSLELCCCVGKINGTTTQYDQFRLFCPHNNKIMVILYSQICRRFAPQSKPHCLGSDRVVVPKCCCVGKIKLLLFYPQIIQFILPTPKTTYVRDIRAHRDAYCFKKRSYFFLFKQYCFLWILCCCRFLKHTPMSSIEPYNGTLQFRMCMLCNECNYQQLHVLHWNAWNRGGFRWLVRTYVHSWKCILYNLYHW